MGIFDFFTKETDRPAEKNKNRVAIGKPINTRENNGGALQVFRPKEFADLTPIIDALKNNRSVIVYVDKMNKGDDMRAIDILSGAIYALDGSMMPIEDNVYICTLDGLTEN
ncbi:MAG: cell division protein SepF [Clostridia bacterium]|nr:cell division protein SepF [Clostridia bacterium]